MIVDVVSVSVLLHAVLERVICEWEGPESDLYSWWACSVSLHVFLHCCFSELSQWTHCLRYSPSPAILKSSRLIRFWSRASNESTEERKATGIDLSWKRTHANRQISKSSCKSWKQHWSVTAVIATNLVRLELPVLCEFMQLEHNYKKSNPLYLLLGHRDQSNSCVSLSGSVERHDFLDEGLSLMITTLLIFLYSTTLPESSARESNLILTFLFVIFLETK